MINTGMAAHRVHVDQTILSLHMSRSRGRAAVGERAAPVVCGKRGRNMTVIMAISDQVSVLYYEVVWGGHCCRDEPGCGPKGETGHS